jgi:phage tail sheath gpL-like
MTALDPKAIKNPCRKAAGKPVNAFTAQKAGELCGAGSPAAIMAAAVWVKAAAKGA